MKPLCREYSFSRVNPRSRVFAAIPEGTNGGPVIEVQIVKIDTYGLDIAIPSPNGSTRTSYVVISRGKSQVVDELRIPIAGLRSSAELLSELQEAEESEFCLAQSKTSIQETGAAHVTSQTSMQETGADTLSIFSQPCVIVHTNHTYEISPACSSYKRGSLSTAISKVVTRLVRHHDQEERQSDLAVQWETKRPVLVNAFAKHGARDFSEKHWLRLIPSTKQQDEVRIL